MSQLVQFGFIFLKKPLLIIPTLKATKQTFSICNRLYGKAHHRGNKANAFRHALWNVLICQKTLKITKNDEKSEFWAKKVTDLYEKVTKNDPLDQAMDLHNNNIGRVVFRSKTFKNDTEIINFLQNMAENAQKVSKMNEIEDSEENLIYIAH
ncbi:hypothetical protein ALE3EI_0842 [Constantimarinum furrinae]|uniref:DUF6973 domain-containing protein n=1 Tax=Constantimarinum furrinae TaxID=2562285 RepID=A0A7G8PSV1_9FLAO|nr:hypothetical protein ALE3EI_0842 [Constantimarinum furrinae]